jgi:threonine/homoserine/homoserine lactone efflux protein
MDYVSIFAISFMVAFSGALVPGPLMTAVIARSASRAGSGALSGPLISIGHAAAESAMLAAIMLGLGRFAHSAAFLAAVTCVGGLMLMVYGAMMLLSLKKFKWQDGGAVAAPRSGLVWEGLLVSVANPYWLIWWVTIGLGLVLSARKTGLFAVAVFFLGHISADFLWNSVVSFTIAKNRRFISEQVYKRLILVCALALAGFGVYFLARVILPGR